MDGAEDARLSPLDLFPVIASRHVVISRISRIQRRRRPLLVLVGSDCGRTSLLGPTLTSQPPCTIRRLFRYPYAMRSLSSFLAGRLENAIPTRRDRNPWFCAAPRKRLQEMCQCPEVVERRRWWIYRAAVKYLCCYELRSSDLTLKDPRKRQPRGAHGAKLVCHGTPIHGALCVMAHQFLASTSISG